MRRPSGTGALVLGATAGYLAGSISFSHIVGRLAAPGEDLAVTRIEVPGLDTSVEFRGFTPTSVKEHAGVGPMAASMALEIAKAAVPTLIAQRALPGTSAAPAAALGSLVGHILPLWNGLRGGYGMTPMIGGLLVLDPVGLAVTTGAVSAAIGVSRRHQLMLVWPVTVPIWALVRGRRDLLGYGIAANAAYWGRLIPELRRGMRGLLTTRSTGSRRGDIATGQADGAERGGDQAEDDQRCG